MAIDQQPGVYFGDDPVQVQCSNCHKRIRTEIERKNGTYTYLMCLLISFVGGSLGCCLIPFCMDSCKDVEHKCPECDQVLGVKKRR